LTAWRGSGRLGRLTSQGGLWGQSSGHCDETAATGNTAIWFHRKGRYTYSMPMGFDTAYSELFDPLPSWDEIIASIRGLPMLKDAVRLMVCGFLSSVKRLTRD
jgi:hypothetical protein